MTDYKPVQDALTSGADPAMLCTTCPWDRNCVTPPTITSAEIDAKLAEATRQDEARIAASGERGAMPTGMLLAAVVYAGKDTSAQVCPVFALRLKSSAGRRLADCIRGSMQDWDDAS